MATRSNIALLVDGAYLTIYCHWDGYPDGVGQTLHDHYKTFDQVQNLILLGNLSSLGPTLGEKHDFDWATNFHQKHGYNTEKWSPEVKAEYDHYNAMCNAYGRDRGERDAGAVAYKSLAEVLRNGEEWLYVFDAAGSTWYVALVGHANNGLPYKSDGYIFNTLVPFKDHETLAPGEDE